MLFDYLEEALQNMWDYHQHNEQMQTWLQSEGPEIFSQVGYMGGLILRVMPGVGAGQEMSTIPYLWLLLLCLLTEHMG